MRHVLNIIGILSVWKHYWSFLNQKYWKEKTLWSDGYFVASIGQVSQETIEHYIESQG